MAGDEPGNADLGLRCVSKQFLNQTAKPALFVNQKIENFGTGAIPNPSLPNHQV